MGRNRERSRLVERRTSYWWVIGLSVATSSPVLAVGVALNATGYGDLSYTFTALGFLLSFTLPILFEQRTVRSRPRKVRLLDYRHHEYGHAIFRSIEAVLADSGRPWRTESHVVTGPDNASRAHAQIERLRHAADEDVDAIVVLPLDADADFWTAASAAMAAGIVVIVLDIDPPMDQFENRGLRPPYSVRTDYASGGCMLGRFIGDQLGQDERSRAIVPMGPPQYFAGRERSRQAAGELVEAGFAERTTFVPIRTWDLEPAVVDEIVREIAAHDGRTIVYTAYDRNAITIRRRLAAEGVSDDHYALVGYDATRDEIGRADVFDHGDAVAAVDVDPHAQGRVVGRLLVQLRTDPTNVHGYRHLVAPRLLLREEYDRELARRT